MSATLEVRPVRDDEAERVRWLHRAALRPAGTDPSDLPDREELDAPASAYDGPGAAFLVGEVSGTVVAMGALRPAGDDAGPPRAATGELKWMRVAPAHQGAGHGRAILEALEAAAREAGYDRLLAETAVRQGAVAFYVHHGYAETARRSADGYELVTLEKAL